MTDDPKPTVPDVLPLVRALYATYDGSCGCCLHIVLDDCNVQDENVDFCIDYAIRNEHPACERIARLLRRMSKTQRRKLAARS